MQLIGHEYIKQTRAYCDYLEEHFNNIAKAFEEVTNSMEQYLIDNDAYYILETSVKHHDLTKFSAAEFAQYRDKFFPVFQYNQIQLDFEDAWRHHYMHNSHHWESATTEIDVLHTVIDWTAMSYKFGGTAQSYYEANQHKIKLNPTLTEFMYTIFNYLKE